MKKTFRFHSQKVFSYHFLSINLAPMFSSPLGSLLQSEMDLEQQQSSTLTSLYERGGDHI